MSTNCTLTDNHLYEVSTWRWFGKMLQVVCSLQKRDNFDRSKTVTDGNYLQTLWWNINLHLKHSCWFKKLQVCVYQSMRLSSYNFIQYYIKQSRNPINLFSMTSVFWRLLFEQLLCWLHETLFASEFAICHKISYQ